MVLVCGLTLVAGGCGSGSQATGDGGSESSTTPPSSPSSSSAAPSSAAPASPSSASPSPTSASSSAPTTPVCTTRDLRVSLTPGEGAAGSVYYQLVLRNVSSAACRTGGFGGVSMVGTAGRQIGAPADRVQRGKVVPIVLAPRGRAHATLRVTQAENYPAAQCDLEAASGLRVFPPNQTASRFVRADLQGCRLAETHLMTLTPYAPQR